MGKFEQSWKEVLEGTELSPSDSVWVNIDHDLAAMEGETMKKRIVLYQRIAAVSILFALLMGALGVYQWSDNSNQLAQNKTLKNTLTSAGNKQNTVNKKGHQPNSALSDTDTLRSVNKEGELKDEMTSAKSTP